MNRYFQRTELSAAEAQVAALWPMLSRRWRALFVLDPATASVELRGFERTTCAARQRLERIGETFVAAFNRSLTADDPRAVRAWIGSIDPEHRGFAAEGAAMGSAIADAVMLGGNRLREWLAMSAEEFTYLAHVGAGWALARVPWRRRAIQPLLDPVHHWLAWDGLGFHDGYFYPSHIRSGWRRVRSGYAARAYDQGVGRVVWFIAGADLDQAIELLERLRPQRQPDLWSGLGLALAYAGGADRKGLHRVMRAAGAAGRCVAQGAAFAAEARARARHVPDHTHEAVEVLCGIGIEDAAGRVRAARAALPVSESPEEPRYEQWRRAVQNTILQRGRRHA